MGHMNWLEENPTRMRRFIAIITTYVWILSVIIAFIAKIGFDKDTIAILALVTAQFATVVGYYMISNAKSDNHKDTE